jgi:hypothetical protein
VNKTTKLIMGLVFFFGLLLCWSSFITQFEKEAAKVYSPPKTIYYDMSLDKIIDEKGIKVYRIKVPDGWIVVFKSFGAGGTTYYPDPTHKWKGVE